MAHAHEGGRDGVEQEPANELVGRQGHGLAPAGVAAISIGEGDGTVLNREQPVVGDGDAMGVAADVVQDRLGAAKSTLGIDHPLLVVELSEQAAKGRLRGEVRDLAGENEAAVVKGCLEKCQELAAKDLGQRLDRKQEVRARGDPPLPIPRERAAGDGAVEMDVVAQGLVPGVQDGSDTDGAAHAALAIGAEFEQGLRDCSEKNVVERLLVSQRDGIELVRDREDKMGIWDWE